MPTLKPAVSIIIITYNNEAFIEKCVLSAIEQSYEPKEVIVIDDGSSDRTRQILEPYMDKISYHYLENSGIPSARNKGLELAQGDFINPMDSDDYFLYAEKISDQIALLEEHPTWGMVQGGFQLVDYEDHAFHYLHPWEQLPIEPSLHDIISRLWFNMQSSLIRREWIDKLGGFDPIYQRAEDVDLIMRMVAEGMIIGLHEKEVVAYRIRQHTRASSVSDLRDADYHLKVWTDLFDSGIFPSEIMQDRQTIMLYKTMWSAYLVARVSEFDALSVYLTQVRAHCPPLHNCGMMAYYWLAFAVNQNHYLKTEFLDPDALIAYLLNSPIFQAVLPADVDATAYLNWWIDIWWFYHQLEITDGDDKTLRERLAEMPTRLSEMNSQPIKQIIKLAQNAITHTAPLPTHRSVAMLSQFCSDLSQARQTPTEGVQVITLFLTMMSRAIFAKQFSVAWLALRRALSHSFHPRAIAPWLRFFRATVQYALQKVSR